jgi:protoporphyrinogen oxidase
MGNLPTMSSRREFLSRAITGLTLPFVGSAVAACSPTPGMLQTLSGPNHRLGHRLRTMDFPALSETTRTDVVIVGGGIAGLSAARYLSRNNVDFALLELENTPGGNSMGGKNNSTSFPWGAHYLPLPNLSDRVLVEFLEESRIITGYENGVPSFNELYLCFDPKERLFIHNYWQDGLVPHEGVPSGDKDQIDRFLGLMHEFKQAHGNDGKEAFAIPVENSSQDPEYQNLDTISVLDFLIDHKFTSPYLHWYVNYCCLDDYGSTLAETSAWAGIHYFASRKGVASNASADTVLTWPEGNFWLANELRKKSEEKIKVQSVVHAIKDTTSGVSVMYYDATSDRSIELQAKAIILATPQYVNQKLLGDLGHVGANEFEYSSWLVSNIRMNGSLDEKRGERLCWDNVFYGSSSLGYIHANHQHLNQPYGDDHTLTYYAPQSSPREQTYKRGFDDWKKIILADLKKAHPQIEKSLREMNCWIWGHGMVKPRPNFIWGGSRVRRYEAINNKIFFAHSDLSGISIFEEAFCNGYKAAQAVLKHV